MSKELREYLIDTIREDLIEAMLNDGFSLIPLNSEERKSRDLKVAFTFGYLIRSKGEAIEQIEIQLDKRFFPYFVINVGEIPSEGIATEGKHYPKESLSVFDVEGSCRLYNDTSIPRLFGPQWFGQGIFPWDKRKRIDKAVKNAVNYYGEIQEWFITKRIGKHMREI